MNPNSIDRTKSTLINRFHIKLSITIETFQIAIKTESSQEFSAHGRNDPNLWGWWVNTGRAKLFCYAYEYLSIIWIYKFAVGFINLLLSYTYITRYLHNLNETRSNTESFWSEYRLKLDVRHVAQTLRTRVQVRVSAMEAQWTKINLIEAFLMFRNTNRFRTLSNYAW